ncbi:MAG: hypothetical protein J0I43_02920 [Microbacterium sp.]|uniref:hypothetical protein n=1 Tax=Microbacterium sp. TaxID=51671 RepID=UPI001AD3B807|nr:hypothetical protein [Microbacterium sp.]MBN9176305.1 hypothetical protein [Microbacterium sp.]
MTPVRSRSGSTGPRPPRTAAPDLPTLLDAHAGLSPRADVIAAHIEGLRGDVSAAHGRVAESRIAGASVGRIDLGGTALSDVAITEIRAAELSAKDASWRSVEIDGGRIGTVDALRGSWDAVILRGLRIDYLSLAAAEVADLLVVDCQIGALDLPDARLARVRFERSRADEVDTRGVRGDDVDLRGLEALSFSDPRGLAGFWLSPRQAELHAPAFAHALGIRIES